MTDKLTDSEIIKALECCANYKNTKCKGCPLEESCVDNNICGLALDLINRLQAENEKLQVVKKHIDILIHRGIEYPTAEAYEKAFQKVLEQLYDNTNAKAEAYKEFAERLFKKAKRRNHKTEEYHYVLADDIVDTLKELVGNK